MNTASSGKRQEGTTYCGFEVGQHVVCVRPSDPGGAATQRILAAGGSAIMPVVNRVYTIRDVYRNSTTGRINIRLGEIVNKSLRTRTGLWEPGFPAERFRPLPKLRVEDFAAEGVSA